MPFLLNIDRGAPGGTRLEWDISPTDRVQMLVPETAVHQVLDLSPDDHIGLSLTDIRPPARTRRRGDRPV